MSPVPFVEGRRDRGAGLGSCWLDLKLAGSDESGAYIARLKYVVLRVWHRIRRDQLRCILAKAACV